MTDNGCIQIDRVGRSFGRKKVLEEVTLEIREAEIFGLLGPSGSGKTTLVKLIAGIDEPTSGEVHVLGVRMPKLEMLGRIGYMAQADALYQELNALENLAFFGALYGLAGSRLKQRIDMAMTLVGLTDALKKPVATYSGGMKRRLSLAIAILHEPRVLILDEPTVGIDPVLRKSIWRELGALRDSGVTVLLTTHVMDEADKCDRLGMIRDGRLIAVGSPEELKGETGASSIEEAFLTFGGAGQ